MSWENSPSRGRSNLASREEVVSELKDYFDDKFRSLQRDLKRDAEWTVTTATKKVKKDSLVSFRNLPNRKQFEFNSSILDLLDNIEKAVTYREATKAIEFLSEARSAITHRNKLIRIADGSETGWSTISEYELLEVASDSEDDKRIRRAEEGAKKRAEKRSFLFDNRSSSFRNNRVSRSLEGRRADGGEVICFRCGQEGHYANACSLQRREFMVQRTSNRPVIPTATESRAPEDGVSVSKKE